MNDNCPYWANPAQNLPPWAVPAGDPDCDGFNNAREAHVGTDPTKHCNANSGFNNEPDFWPTDFNDSQLTDLSDVVSMGGTFNKLKGQAGYNQRYDLDASNSVVLTDVIAIGPFWLRFCT